MALIAMPRAAIEVPIATLMFLVFIMISPDLFYGIEFHEYTITIFTRNYLSHPGAFERSCIHQVSRH